MSFWKTLGKEIVVLLLVLALIVFTPFAIQRELRYQKAINFLKNEDYSSASSILFSLENYKDSASLANKCQDRFYENIDVLYDVNTTNRYELYNLLRTINNASTYDDIKEYLKDVDAKFIDFTNEKSISVRNVSENSRKVLFRKYNELKVTNLSFFGVSDRANVEFLFDNDNNLQKMKITISSCALSERVVDYLTNQLTKMYNKGPIYDDNNVAYWDSTSLRYTTAYPFHEYMTGDMVYHQGSFVIYFEVSY